MQVNTENKIIFKNTKNYIKCQTVTYKINHA